ncbi:hypothetical protein GX441_03045 [bacterium]|nr:hypothetical protein [bacterium]
MVKFSASFFCAVTVFFFISGCSKPDDFELTVVPKSMDAIAGQRCVFLVQLPEEERDSVPVYINGRVKDKGAIISYSPVIQAGVAEVTFYPDSSSIGDTLTMEIQASRSENEISTEEVSIAVLDWDEGPQDEAEEIRDTFISWLSVNYPELALDKEGWIGTTVSPGILEVSHYLFFSDNWEFHVSWHIMIAPYDWAEMYLRRRGYSETAPSYAFKIDSWSAGDEPHPTTPPDSVWR